MTASVSRRLNILFIDYSVFHDDAVSHGYMWGVAFHSHVESTCLTSSFNLEGRLRSIKLV